MKSIFSKYFQKSRVFLYPLINLRKGSGFKPQETYVIWDGVYRLRDVKLICTFANRQGRKLRNFETKYLIPNKLVDDVTYFDDGCVAVFNLSTYKEDFKYFIDGKYSKFTFETKEIINKHFTSRGKVNKYVDSYLFPNEYHQKYAEDLDVDLDIIKDTFELCDKPDIKLETFKPKLSKIFVS